MPEPTSPISLDVVRSGSKGNCSIVVCQGRALVVDCGVTRRAFLEGLDAMGIGFADVEGLLITHEHSDHTKGLGVVLRAFKRAGLRPPLYAVPQTLSAIPKIDEVEGLYDPRELALGDNGTIAGMRVEAFATSHDAVRPVGFRFESADDALGFMTDTGVVPDGALDGLSDCRVLALESNYDVAMLHDGPYPRALQQRVEGDRGHLSNDQCARLAARLAGPRLEWVVAMHISENNNTYGMPVRAVEASLKACGCQADVVASSQRRQVVVSPQNLG